MHLHDQIPIGIFHVLERNVAEDTSIVQKNVDGSKRLHGSGDNLLTKLDGIVVGNSLSARGLDLIDNNICSLDTAVSTHRHPRVTRNG